MTPSSWLRLASRYRTGLLETIKICFKVESKVVNITQTKQSGQYCNIISCNSLQSLKISLLGWLFAKFVKGFQDQPFKPLNKKSRMNFCSQFIFEFYFTLIYLFQSFPFKKVFYFET